MQHPDVLRAVNPWYAVDFFVRDGLAGFLILGAVVLVLTGGEALYADMGHFGRRPIRLAWFSFVLPALMLNYFGQAALLLQTPAAVENPFYALVPERLLYPMVVVATSAAIVASQALISGAFSLTQQAVQLGYSPRMTIVHTSAQERGQIYVPEVNWGLMVACVWLVVNFKSTSNLAAAYGIAVTGTMAITTVLFGFVARERWHWRLGTVIAVCTLFLAVDLAFLSANLVKFAQGGWFPCVVAAGIYTLMSTWKLGRRRLGQIMEDISLPLDLFLSDFGTKAQRVPGTAVFMTRYGGGAPPVLLHHVKHNKVLHEQVILLTIRVTEEPHVPSPERLHAEHLPLGFHRIVASYGFMEQPRVLELLKRWKHQENSELRITETTFFLSRESIVPSKRRQLAGWRSALFAFLQRNAQPATAFFGLPVNRVVELGVQVEL
jgi:KUP system potassium uptake protein